MTWRNKNYFSSRSKQLSLAQMINPSLAKPEQQQAEADHKLESENWKRFICRQPIGAVLQMDIAAIILNICF